MSYVFGQPVACVTDGVAGYGAYVAPGRVWKEGVVIEAALAGDAQHWFFQVKVGNAVYVEHRTKDCLRWCIINGSLGLTDVLARDFEAPGSRYHFASDKDVREDARQTARALHEFALNEEWAKVQEQAKGWDYPDELKADVLAVYRWEFLGRFEAAEKWLAQYKEWQEDEDLQIDTYELVHAARDVLR